jgi:hypothetical protein
MAFLLLPIPSLLNLVLLLLRGFALLHAAGIISRAVSTAAACLIV